jgi:hypothetical protein
VAYCVLIAGTERNKNMSKDLININKEIDNEINNERLSKFKEELKNYKLEQLKWQEQLKEQKEHIEDKLRIVKLNLENLDKGNFDAIEERIRKSQEARQLSNVNFTWIPDWFNESWTRGTFTLPNGKIFYF